MIKVIISDWNQWRRKCHFFQKIAITKSAFFNWLYWWWNCNFLFLNEFSSIDVIYEGININFNLFKLQRYSGTTFNRMTLHQSFLRKMISKIGSRTSRMSFYQLFYDKDNKIMFSESDFICKSQNIPNYKTYMKDFLWINKKWAFCFEPTAMEIRSFWKWGSCLRC